MAMQNLAPCPLQFMRLIAHCVPKSTEERFHSQVIRYAKGSLAYLWPQRKVVTKVH